MQYEVFTIGSGRFLYNFFGAVAAVTQSAQFQGAITTAMLVSGLWVTFILAFRPTGWDTLRTWMAASILIIGLMLTPKATVKVTDRIDPAGSAGYIIANVPAGLAAFAGFTSLLGDETTRLLETGMADVDAPKLRAHGFNFGARLLANATRLEIGDADFSASLSAFIRNCLFYDIMLGRKSLDELKTAPDPWAYVTGNPSRARMFVLHERDAAGTRTSTVRTCEAGVAALNRQWSAEIPAAARRLALFSRPADARTGGAAGTGGTWNEARVRLLTGHVMNDLGSFHRYLVGASRASADILKRQMTINAVVNEPLNWNAELGNAAAVQSYIDARLDLQTRQSYRGVARQAEQWVLYLKAVFQGLYYAVFPIALLLMLSPMGVVVLRNWLFGLVWIESWGPLYAVINYFVTAGAQDRMTALVNASGGAGGTTGDIPLIAQAGIRAVEADIAVQAGYLLMSAPFIAIALAAGAGRFAMLATSTLAVSQEAVADTTRESATGNMSIGNTSHDTHAFHNYTGFSHNTSAAWDSGRTSAWADSGALVTQTPDGRMVVAGQHSQSSFATDVNWGQSLSASLSQQASESRQAAETTGVALADSRSAMRSLTSGFTDSVSAGRGHDFAYGTDARVTASEDVNTVTSAAQDWARKQGVDEKDLIDASDGNAQPIAAKLINSAMGARRQGGIRRQCTSSNISFDEALRFSRQDGVSEALGRLTSASSSESARWQTGENQNYADSVSAAFNQSRELRESRDASLQEAERLEAAASLVESRSSSINAALGQPFLEWVQTQPSLHGEGNMSFHEAEALLNSGDIVDRSRAVLLADKFLEAEAHRYIDDPQVAAMMRRIDPEGTQGQNVATIRRDADIADAHLRHAGSVPTQDGETIRADNLATTQQRVSR